MFLAWEVTVGAGLVTGYSKLDISVSILNFMLTRLSRDILT